MENKTNKKYTAVTREHNSWEERADGSVYYPRTWDCGHKHHTPKAALKCLDSMGNAACSYHANVEDCDGNVIDRYDIE